jgi:hypothetical protein
VIVAGDVHPARSVESTAMRGVAATRVQVDASNSYTLVVLER